MYDPMLLFNIDLHDRLSYKTSVLTAFCTMLNPQKKTGILKSGFLFFTYMIIDDEAFHLI